MIITLFLINIIIKLYKFYKYSYLFTVKVERFISLNGVNLLTYFKFTNLFASSFIKWRNGRCFIKIIESVLYVIYNDKTFINQYHNKKLCVTIFEVNPVNKLHVAISDPIFIKYNDYISANELYNKIKWNNIATKNISNVTIIIRIR